MQSDDASKLNLPTAQRLVPVADPWIQKAPAGQGVNDELVLPCGQQYPAEHTPLRGTMR